MNPTIVRIIAAAFAALVAALALAPGPAHGDAPPSDVLEVPPYARARTEIVQDLPRADAARVPLEDD